MAKRGYKLQEFVAHSANVNCIKIGKKTFRHFITGGDDERVNLWSIGKPTSVVSLCGHTSPVESVAFDSAEVLVAAGASSGAIKLWDLEETKLVRSLSGHRSYCTAVEFHPFGEFFASGSMDTNLKIWDIRKKGCIHTYKGHTRGISNIRFTPDGRWVVSGGLDNAVKIWDLTAGKLLHDFKFHEGHIRSIDFHPLEFLLATGSGDRTVKFWDLETFELIGSTRPEGTGVRSITFHPDGRTLFCGLDSSLKVYSWEPVISHDAVEMGWSTLGDLCIHDGKLLGCSYYQNSVGVWVADVSLIEPYGDTLIADQNGHPEQKNDLQGSLLERVGSHRRSTSNLRSIYPDYDSKEIKNIYVDCGTPLNSRKSEFAPKDIKASDSKEINDLATTKQVPVVGVHAKNSGLANRESFAVPIVVPRESPDQIDPVKSRRESIASGRGSIATLVKSPHARRPSSTKLDLDRISVSVESLSFESMTSALDTTMGPNFENRVIVDDAAKISSDEKLPIIKSFAEKFENLSSPRTHSNQGNCDESLDLGKGSKSVKYVNGVAVVHGRTRSLVEKFEKREQLNTNECQTPDTAPQVTPDTAKTSPILAGQTPDTASQVVIEPKTSPMPVVRRPDTVSPVVAEVKTSPMLAERRPDTAPHVAVEAKTFPMPLIGRHDTPTNAVFPAKSSPVQLTREPDIAPLTVSEKAKASNMSVVRRPDMVSPVVVEAITSPMLAEQRPDTAPQVVLEAKTYPMPLVGRHDTPLNAVLPAKSSPVQLAREPDIALLTVPEKAKASSTVGVQIPDTTSQVVREKVKASSMRVVRTPNPRPQIVPEKAKASPMRVARTPDTAHRILRARASPMVVARTPDKAPQVVPEKAEMFPMVVVQIPDTSPRIIHENAETPPLQDDCQQITGPELMSKNDNDIIEDLMQNHDVLLSTLRSRLTKLQVVRHFWERNDVKGAINALRKLPDHSVQADVISVLLGKMEIITLDLFSCLLPVLLGLLNSKTERHTSISLEMLLKLVAVFGPVVNSTISAPPAVGVDLQAEKRLECCNQCFMQLQKIQNTLPAIIRRGGLLAKCARELNLVLQQS